jgi:hypothetical protein
MQSEYWHPTANREHHAGIADVGWHAVRISLHLQFAIPRPNKFTHCCRFKKTLKNVSCTPNAYTKNISINMGSFWIAKRQTNSTLLTNLHKKSPISTHWNRGVFPLFNKHLNRTKKQSNLAIQFQYHCTHFPEEAHPALATSAPLNSKMVMTLEFEHVVNANHKNLDITLCLALIVVYVRIDQLLTFIYFAH